MATRYWLMKSEPDVFSIDDLVNRHTAPWDGIRNYQVRNLLRDQFQVGDQAFFYHSSCPEPAIVGIMTIVSMAYPDSTALDPHHRYFDPKSSVDKLPWYCVDVEIKQKLPQPITLKTLRLYNEVLGEFALLKRGNRLSITAITPEQWTFILSLASTS